MARNSILRIGSMMIALAMLAAPAAAQSMTCRQLAAELAQPSPAGNLQQAAGQRRQYAQVQSTLAAMGCGDGAFAPAQCAGLRQQATALAGSINRLEAGTRPDPARRAQVQASYDSNCRTAARPEAPRPPAQAQIEPASRSLFDALFNTRTPRAATQDDAPRYATNYDPTQPFRDLEVEAKRRAAEAERLNGEPRRALGGRLPVCVRSCDGFFFPVNYQGAQDQHGDLCRASCPDAKVELYFMSPGAPIETAVSAKGAPYTELAAASAYRKAYDASCTCKRATQAWGSVLQQAEALIRRKGDTIVSGDEKTSGMQALSKSAQDGESTENNNPAQAIDPDLAPELRKPIRAIGLR